MRVFLWAVFATGLTIIGYWAALTALIYFQLGKFGIADRAWDFLTHNYVWLSLLLVGLTLMATSLSLLFRRPRILN